MITKYLVGLYVKGELRSVEEMGEEEFEHHVFWTEDSPYSSYRWFDPAEHPERIHPSVIK